jgi:hypothetical protein
LDDAMAPLDEKLVQRLRAHSKIVFGQELRLAVMLAIARDPEPLFTQSELAAAVHVPHDSAVQLPLKALIASRVIYQHPREPSTRSRWLQRSESSLWLFAEEQAAVALAPILDNYADVSL